MDIKQLLSSTPTSSPTRSAAFHGTLQDPIDQDKKDHGAQSAQTLAETTKAPQEVVRTRMVSSDPLPYDQALHSQTAWTYFPDFGMASGIKRTAPLQQPDHHLVESSVKKGQSKWTNAEDELIIELRGSDMTWEDISKHVPGRSAISCRLRFQNYLERRSQWDEEKKNKLAMLYERFKKDMWKKIAKDMQVPWRVAEAMHWQIGEVEMGQRAGAPVFHLADHHSSPAGGPPEQEEL